MMKDHVGVQLPTSRIVSCHHFDGTTMIEPPHVAAHAVLSQHVGAVIAILPDRNCLEVILLTAFVDRISTCATLNLRMSTNEYENMQSPFGTANPSMQLKSETAQLCFDMSMS
jgi:hypothetical protein